MQDEMVSIIIPVKKINDYIKLENLPALANQTYQKYEVIVLPDEKNAEDSELLKKYNWLRIIETGHIAPGKKRAIGVENAKGNLIAFIDDDAYPHKNWLANAIKHMNEQNIKCVCGPAILTENPNFWEKIFDGMLCNPIGSGVYMYRFKKMKPKFTDDYPFVNFVSEKEILQRVGNRDSEYWPGEDSKICKKIVYEFHEKIYYHPEILVYHHRRENLYGFIKQNARYGRQRGIFFFQGDENSRRLQYVLPPIFLIYLFLLYISTLYHFLYNPINYFQYVFIPLIPYGILLLYMIIEISISTKNLINGITSAIVTVLTHIIYGLMFIEGFVSQGLRSWKKLKS